MLCLIVSDEARVWNSANRRNYTHNDNYVKLTCPLKCSPVQFEELLFLLVRPLDTKMIPQILDIAGYDQLSSIEPRRSLTRAYRQVERLMQDRIANGFVDQFAQLVQIPTRGRSRMSRTSCACASLSG